MARTKSANTTSATELPGEAVKGTGPGSSNGQGSGSALAEMLRRQAQNPRPGAVQQAPRPDAPDEREPRQGPPRKRRG